MLDDKTIEKARLKAAKERAARERAREKARTPEARAKAKAYREKVKAAKAKAAQDAWAADAPARRLRTLEGWRLRPIHKWTEHYAPHILEGADAWSTEFYREIVAYVYPTVLGWETSLTMGRDKMAVIFDSAKGRNIGKAPAKAKWRTLPALDLDEAVGHLSVGGNIGVRLRDTDLVVDVDPRHFAEGDDPLARLLKDFGLPECPTVLTGGGGSHHYLRKPADLTPSTAPSCAWPTWSSASASPGPRRRHSSERTGPSSYPGRPRAAASRPSRSGRCGTMSA